MSGSFWVQPTFLSSLDHCIHQVEKISRATSRNSCDSVDQGFLIDPHGNSDRFHDFLGLGTLAFADPGVSIHSRCTVAGHRRGVGHDADQWQWTTRPRFDTGNRDSRSNGHDQRLSLKQVLSNILYGTLHDLRFHGQYQDICDVGSRRIVGAGLYRKILGKRLSDAVIRV